MTDRPIIFSAPMVRALLEGRKTQTRRLLKPQPIASAGVVRFQKVGTQTRTGRFVWECHSPKGPVAALPSAPGCLDGHAYTVAAGDRLWVREALALTNNVNDHDNWPGRPHIDTGPGEALIYRADGDWHWCDGNGFSTERSMWRPSIHMPRWASRLTLHVEAVRVQRLQDISAEDAIAEGIAYPPKGMTMDEAVEYGVDPRGGFRTLWGGIHGCDAWAANPWVTAITFRVERRNIDANPTTPTPEPTP